jgi:hemerythrin-like domain-containing protein
MSGKGESIMNVTNALQDHHKQCDSDFAIAEEAAQNGDWLTCAAAFAKLRDDMHLHFRIEEDVLFTAFEKKTGMTSGPTQVMRHEHNQIIELLKQLEAALQKKNGDEFGGVAETLLIMMQQHNMKEEKILYPMCDDALGSDMAIISQINDGLYATCDCAGGM